MPQTIFLVSRAIVIDALKAKAGHPLTQGLYFGGSTPAQVIEAINTIPPKAEPDLLDLPKVMNTLHDARTNKMLGGANSGLNKVAHIVKSSRVPFPQPVL